MKRDSLGQLEEAQEIKLWQRDESTRYLCLRCTTFCVALCERNEKR